MHTINFIRRLVVRILLVPLILLPPLSYAKPAHSASIIVIGEVAWAGSSSSTADEWIELWNLGDQDVVLSGYSLRGGSDKPIFLPENAVIPARGTFLISNYPDTDSKSVLGVPSNLVTSTLSLSNSNLKLILHDTSGEIDTAGTGSMPPAGSSGAIKTTMIRTETLWTNATTTQGMDPEKTDLGTPGYCDGCSLLVPIEEPKILPAPETPQEEPATEPEQAPITPSSTPATEETVEPVEEPSEPPTEAPQEEVPEIVQEPTLEPIPETEEHVTSTEELPVLEQEAVPTSTEEVLPSVTTSSETIPPTTETQSPSNQYELLRLNEIVAQPDGEDEWIELTSIQTSVPVMLAGMTLHDATGKIATIATGTIDTVTPFVRIGLTSARLNNSGDTVTLKDPGLRIVDGLTFTSSEKGYSWIRTPDASGDWKQTETPTPGAANVLTEEVEEETEPVTTSSPTTQTTSTVSSVVLPNAPVLVTPTQSTSSSVLSTTVSATSKTATSTAKKTTTKQPVKAPSSTSTTATTAKKTTTATKKSTTPAAKTTTKKITAAPHIQSITHVMAHDETYAGIPVVLQGVVGTPPGLISGHYFVLLAQDGRGLNVHVPTSRKLPEYGAEVRVTGVLKFTDKGVPSLGMRKNDALEAASSTAKMSVRPRLVDLLAPSNEDAWSFVHVTGTVLNVKGTTITLDLQDAEVLVTIKPLTGYRAARIQVGDTLHVRGVLDTKDETARLYVRSAEDIEIAAHAAPKATGTTKRTLPGWMPFGAAAVAVAGTEGAKKLRARWKQRSLEKILQTGLNR